MGPGNLGAASGARPLHRTGLPGYFDSALASRSAFAIVERASGLMIGSSRYHDYDPAKREIEIGWTFLARAYWGGSTNREVKHLMLTHAFSFVDTVVFWVGETNWRSQIGGVRRREPGIRILDGKSRSHVIFEIRKDGPNNRTDSVSSSTVI